MWCNYRIIFLYQVAFYLKHFGSNIYVVPFRLMKKWLLVMSQLNYIQSSGFNIICSFCTYRLSYNHANFTLCLRCGELQNDKYPTPGDFFKL